MNINIYITILLLDYFSDFNAHADRSVGAERLILFMTEKLKAVKVLGGMASDDYTFAGQLVFTNGRQSNRDMAVLVKDKEKINIKGKATCGWKAVGIEKTLIKGHRGNIIFESIPGEGTTFITHLPVVEK